MWIVALSAALVGFIHSLAPGHWLPVVLMAKARKWNMRQAIVGASIAALGHILIASGIGIAAHTLGAHFIAEKVEAWEPVAAFCLIVFGVSYSFISLFYHRKCHGHEHHGPVYKEGMLPYFFLFTVGLNPCVAVLPLFAASVGFGGLSLFVTIALFSVGALSASVGGSLLVSKGWLRLDHPLFEHYGETLTGFVVALMGAFLWFFPHTHDL